MIGQQAFISFSHQKINPCIGEVLVQFFNQSGCQYNITYESSLYNENSLHIRIYIRWPMIDGRWPMSSVIFDHRISEAPEPLYGLRPSAIDHRSSSAIGHRPSIIP